jgi:hypothetical protein
LKLVERPKFQVVTTNDIRVSSVRLLMFFSEHIVSQCASRVNSTKSFFIDPGQYSIPMHLSCHPTCRPSCGVCKNHSISILAYANGRTSISIFEYSNIPK